MSILETENEDFNLNKFWSQVNLDFVPEFPLLNTDSDDKKIKIPLRSLDLNLNDFNKFPPASRKHKKISSKPKRIEMTNKENICPDVLTPLQLRKNSSEGRNSIESLKSSQIKLTAHSKSAFKPLKQSKATDTTSNTLKSSMSLISRMEQILSANHQTQVKWSPKMDYTLWLSLVSSLWSSSNMEETSKLYQKHSIWKPAFSWSS